MPLTVRTNGSASQNIITATWFNDIRDLLTGTMKDQLVQIANTLYLSSTGVSPSGVASVALQAGTGLGIGAYKWVYTYANIAGTPTSGYSAPSPSSSISTTSGNQQVRLTSVSVGPVGTVRRAIWRTAVGAASPPAYKYVGSINDNSTTTFTDTVPDGSLGMALPSQNSFGGTLATLDASSTVRSLLASDGSLWNNTTGITVNGSVSGTATLYQPLQGPNLKVVVVNLNAWRSASNIPVTLPAPFTNNLFGIAGVVGIAPDGGLGLVGHGGAVLARIFTALGASGGSSSPQSVIPSASIFYVGNGGNDFTDQVNMLANTSAHTASMWLVGN